MSPATDLVENACFEKNYTDFKNVLIKVSNKSRNFRCLRTIKKNRKEIIFEENEINFRCAKNNNRADKNKANYPQTKGVPYCFAIKTWTRVYYKCPRQKGLH